jgi:aminoglycoside phosphotransferase (APT) family kinase protein
VVKLRSGEIMVHFRPLSLTSKNENEAEISIFKKLCDYFSTIKSDARSSFLPKGVTTASISEFKRLNARKIGNASFSFLLSYKYQKNLKQRYFVLKIYRQSLDPVLKKYIANENFNRCLKEFQILRALESVDFFAPKVILCETDSNVIGYPFLIMQREEINQRSTFDVNSFSRNLAMLHSLDVNRLGISALNKPQGALGFARDCFIYLKMYLNLYPKHRKGLMKDFDFALHWIESNLSNNSCLNYRLLHGDYRARLNTILTKDGRLLIADWEDSQIGDSIYDVGVAYVRAQIDFDKQTADRFVQKYLTYFDGDLSEKINFYKTVAYLRLAITHSSILSSPLRAYEIRGSKALLFFPFLSFPFISRSAGTDLDDVYIENFKEFVEENLKR